jgi:hypothetical protein
MPFKCGRRKYLIYLLLFDRDDREDAWSYSLNPALLLLL